MIIEKGTVFVVGAGASVPYALPSGEGLKRMVIDDALQTPTMRPESVLALEASGADHTEFIDVIKAIARSGAPSIDDWARDNPRYDHITKALIASALLHRERDGTVCPDRGFPKGCDWLGYLLNDLISSASLAHVTFVTFNFDRVIERRAVATMQGRYVLGEDRRRAAERLTGLEVVHVSGILGYPEWAGRELDRTVPFSHPVTTEHVQIAIRMIQYVHEPRADSALARASDLIRAAPLVAFIGFGFHPVNVNALKIEAQESTVFIGSGIGLEAAEAREHELRFSRYGRLRLYEKCHALDFLKCAPNLHGRREHPAYGPWVSDSIRGINDEPS